MKVYHIIGSLDENAGGPSRSVPQTCIELSKLGLEVEIIARPSEHPVSIPENNNLKVTFLSLRELKEIASRWHQTTVNLVHLQHVWDPYIHVAARAAQKNKIPYLITPRGMLEPWIMKYNPLKKKLGMLLYQRADLNRANLIHATCQMEKDNIRKLGFHNPIEIIPNGIDMSQVPAAKETFGSKKLVFLSRIHPKKGIDLLLDTWKEIDKGEWTLEIAGNGDAAYIDTLQRKIKQENISRVSFVGAEYGEAKWAFLKSADLFILPTYSENFGIVVAEALAVGVPVITTTGTPWKELITYKCGWWTDLSISNILTAIQDAMSLSQEKLLEMGNNGQRLIRVKYDIKSVAAQMFSCYNRILK